MTTPATALIINGRDISITFGEPYHGLLDEIDHIAQTWEVPRSRAICQLIMIAIEHIKSDGRVFTKEQLEGQPEVIQSSNVYQKIVSMLTKGNGDLKNQINMITIGKIILNGEKIE